MYETEQNIILLFSDPLVREGLKLLLEDMQYVVISAGSFAELQKTLATQKIQPCLIILPQVLDNEKPVNELIDKLREKFTKNIPVILLSDETDRYPPRIVNDDVVVLPEQIKPSALRERIKQIVNNNPSPLQNC